MLAFAGRNPMLSAALVGLTVAIIVTEIRRLFLLLEEAFKLSKAD